MGTSKIIIAAVVAVAAVAFYVLLGPSPAKTAAKKAWAKRLEQASVATEGERAVEGTIEATGELLDVPGGGSGAAAYAAWTNTKRAASKDTDALDCAVRHGPV